MDKDNLNKRIGYELRSARLLRRMTLEQVAKALGFSSRNTVSYLELGKKDIDVETLVRYCDVVGCDWIELLKRVTNEK